MRKRKLPVMRKAWKVRLASEPYGIEEFEGGPGSSALTVFRGLLDAAEKEFQQDRIPREISLVCHVGRDKS